MTPEQIKEAKLVAFASSNYSERQWFAAGTEIWMGSTVIGYTRTPEAAQYICRLHNIYLALANDAIVLRTELKDLRKLLTIKGDQA